MGTPVNPNDGLGIKNGTFATKEYWEIINGWAIDIGTCGIHWTEESNDYIIKQSCKLQPNIIYQVEFNLVGDDFPGGSGLRVRLGDPPAPESDLLTNAGFISIPLSPIVRDANITFYIDGSADFPGESEIDNVVIKAISYTLAVTYNLMPTQNTQSEIVFDDVDGSNTVLANWRDKSNILIATEK